MKLKNKIIIKGLFHSLLQSILVFLFAWYNDCIIEMLIVYLCFFYFRTKFSKQYHALTSWGCTIVTIIVYLIVSYIIPSKSISILIVVLLTYLINKISFIYRDYLDLLSITKVTLKIGICESDFNKFISTRKLTEVEIRRLKLKYVDKLNNPAIAKIECVELATIEKFFSRLKRKMSS